MISLYAIGVGAFLTCMVIALPMYVFEGETTMEVWRRLAIVVGIILFWPVALFLFIVWGVCAGLKDWKNAL